MSAAIFGANLLEEVQEEGLDELLSDLRRSFEPEPKNVLGILEIDRLLHLFRYPDVLTAEEHREDWTSSSPGHNEESPTRQGFAETRRTKKKQALIEIGHSPSNSGKTNLLYYLTAASILPKIYNGKESTVVWLDTDVLFSATRLHEICINFLNLSDPPLIQSEKQDVAYEALKHVHVFSPSSSKQLLSTLENLEPYLLQVPQDGTIQTKHHSLHRPLSLIILDSATSFYWTDRFDAEIARLESIRSPAVPAPTELHSSSTSTQILARLKTLQVKFECVAIYTTNKPPSIRPSRVSTGPSEVTPLRPLPGDDESPSLSLWTWAATLSLTMTRLPVPQFASYMSLEECLRDRTNRQEIAARNRVRVGVSEEWLGVVVRDARVKEALSMMAARGAFVMRLTEKGVDIE